MARRPSDVQRPERSSGLVTNGLVEGPDWREWMRELGRRQRQLREFAGLSQEQLAKLAGVSQGAVSRLEIARGIATPLLVVLKINAALAHVLSRMDPAVLSPEMREAVVLQGTLVPSRGVLGFKELPVAEDREFEELVRLYRDAPPRNREGLVSVLRAMIDGLKPALT